MRINLPLSALLLGAAFAGCSEGEEGENVGPAACEDFVRTIGDVAERCGFDRQQNESVFETVATGGGGCEAVTGIRDIDALYDDCLPWFEAITCAQFNDPELTVPPSCRSQFVLAP